MKATRVIYGLLPCSLILFQAFKKVVLKIDFSLSEGI